MKNIEVELRSFITKEKYEELIDFFKQNAKFVNKDDQVTYYFDSKEDLRIQKNNFFSKIWLKKGKIHDESREEIEIKFDKEDFEILEKLFLVLGYNIEIKWFRKRHSFKWQDIVVMLDYTRGYGYILELEDKSSEQDKDLILNKLKEKLNNLNIKLTPKEEFDKKFEYYKNNWKELIK
ncbi:MAG: CYTH domain-containing protein [Candidatus Nanoarchaeia archaeon]|jgi:predicted adenylyl cyclase CyaB|nr:CYTH domain-containing protein [Candidatus Nanoarchaeia archaeon]|tara:strand:- start:17639 stop:18172 length:534 start_codon:yes stop_codon:yes gene_type:complete